MSHAELLGMVGIAGLSPHLLATAKKTTSSSLTSLLPILILVVLAFYLFTRPQKRRQKQQLALMQTLAAGDQVLTTSGIYGTVRSVQGDRIELDIADGVTIAVARQAVAQKLAPPVDAQGDDDDFETRFHAVDAPAGQDAGEDDEYDEDEDDDDDEDYDEDDEDEYDEDDETDDEDEDEEAGAVTAEASEPAPVSVASPGDAAEEGDPPSTSRGRRR
jgi:preprotein translocase subunit YajC